jgi:hypothetical protein
MGNAFARDKAAGAWRYLLTFFLVPKIKEISLLYIFTKKNQNS